LGGIVKRGLAMVLWLLDEVIAKVFGLDDTTGGNDNEKRMVQWKSVLFVCNPPEGQRLRFPVGWIG